MSIIESERVRRLSSATDDVRALKTRQRIIAALSALESAGQGITVSAIVDRAGISRSVFYRHFAHLDELAIYLLDQALDAVSRADVDRREGRFRHGSDVVREDVQELVSYLAQHRSLYKAALRSESGPRAADRMRRAYITRVNAHLPHFAVPVTVAEVSTELAFYAGGLVAVLSDWLTSDADRGPDEQVLVDLLVQRVPSWMA